MPAKSQSQQRASGMALAAKRGKVAMSKLYGAAKQMAKSMTVEQLRHFAKTVRRGLPKHKRQEVRRKALKRALRH